MASGTGVRDGVRGAGAADGRTARSQRTRDSVVEALLDLLGDGNPRPTAREIAARAGVSLRSVYVHFDDLEDLFLAAAGRHLERIMPLLAPAAAEGPLAARITAYTDRQARLLEASAPVQRAAALQEPFSPTIAEIRRSTHLAISADLARVFARELDTRPAERRGRTLLALVTAASSGAWDLARRLEGLDVDAARATMHDTFAALLRDPGSETT